MGQLDLFAARELRDAGIQQAVDHADQVKENWSEDAYNFLLGYLPFVDTFMTEEVREAAEGMIDEPPSKRAWGAVILRAAKAGLIHRVGYKQTNNKKSHKTPASLWRVNK